MAKHESIPDSVYENAKLSWSVSADCQVTQRVNADFVASTSIPQTPYLVQTKAKARSEQPNSANIEELWPSSAVDPAVKLDIDPSPPSLMAKYEETVFGSSPLFYFVKQVLNKARSCMDSELYVAALKELTLSPDDLDKRYNSRYGDSKYLEHAELKVAEEGISFAESVGRLRARDTQIQTILAMELYCVAPSSASASTSASTSASASASASPSTSASVLSDLASPSAQPVHSKSSPTNSKADANLQLYFDRLCIWQAVGTHPNSATDFCSSILIPYYKARSPKKTRQLVKVSKGTVRTGHIKQKPKVAPRLIKAPGFLRALELQNIGTSSIGSGTRPNSASSFGESPHSTPSSTPSTTPSVSSPPAKEPTPVLQATRTHSRPSAARSISHPIYRQQSLGGTVEIRFKPVRRGDRNNSSTSNKPVAPSPSATEIFKSTSALGPAPLVSAPPASPPRERQSIIPNSIQATPEKERQRYLSLPLEDSDEEIGSTDSD